MTKIGLLVGGQLVLYAEVPIIDMPKCRHLRYRIYMQQAHNNHIMTSS